ncbi:MAG TPA: hypothetical protein PLL06_19640 [Acidobacteriota bacterium]|nr:hypothetical protein [Acidobacteriota bacterium]
MHLGPSVIFLVLTALGMCFCTPVQAQAHSPTLEQQAAQFRAYREALRKDTHRQKIELRHWNGPVHKLMSELGDRLEQDHLPEKQVIKLLGKPDDVISGGKRHSGMLVPKNEKHLLYWWRGGHDYLYLVVRQGKIAEARWWYAGE